LVESEDHHECGHDENATSHAEEARQNSGADTDQKSGDEASGAIHRLRSSRSNLVAYICLHADRFEVDVGGNSRGDTFVVWRWRIG